jgi:hypothetical protein
VAVIFQMKKKAEKQKMGRLLLNVFWSSYEANR